MGKHFKHLNLDETAEIRVWKRLKKTDTFIANKLGRHQTTITRFVESPAFLFKEKQVRKKRCIANVVKRRRLVYKYADQTTWETVSWKVWEGTAREETRTRVYIKPTYPTARHIREVLFQKHTIKVSAYAVWNDLKLGGFLWRRRTKVVTMDPEHWKARLQFSLYVKPLIPGLFLGFADECQISSAVDSTLVFHYRRRDQPSLPRWVSRASGKGAKLHIWACIAPGYRKIICFDRSVTMEVYVEQCLSQIWKDMLAMGMTLIQDNAGAHGSASKDFLDKKGCFYLEIPPYSPDINLIERLWLHLKRRVSARYFTSDQDLKKIVEEEFELIPQHIIDGICDGFGNCINKIIKNKGKHFSQRM